mgnify:FL=1
MTTTKNNEHKKLNFSSEREQNQACLNSAKHEKNQGRKVLNVPNLRFPEFQGEWEKCILGDITENFNLRNKDKIQYPMFSVTNDRGFVPQSEQFEGRDMVGEDIKAYKIIHTNDFAYNPARINVGSIAMYTGEKPCMISSLYVCFKTTKEVNNEWLMQLLKTPKMNYYYNVNGEGGVRVYLFYPNFARIRMSIPKIEEQKKIAKLLNLIDERIATQNKIIEDLKKLKSAIVEKVFCSPNQEYPMCRIEGFEQALSTYKMSDFSSRIATKNKDSKCSLVLTIAAQYGLVNQESFFNKSVASDNLTGYYLLHKGEFAYNRSYSAGYDWGAVKRLDNYDEGVLSTLYICFKINETIVDSDYLAYYFESTKWHRGLSDIAGEGARNHGLLNVSMADYFNTKHRFPVIEEQKAIAKILNAITEKERKATLLGECYQKQKQYLLRQMFI